MIKTVASVVVTLDHWHSERYGERWTITFEGKPLLTFGTEFEARLAARKHSWTVQEAAS